MVKTPRPKKYAYDNREATKSMIEEVYGRVLTLRVITETKDDYGQLSTRSTADTTFMGDIQFGLDLDKRLLELGIVEIGDAVLYIHPDALTTEPKPEDIVVDGNSRWEVISKIENAELQGSDCHFSYRLKRRVEGSD